MDGVLGIATALNLVSLYLIWALSLWKQLYILITMSKKNKHALGRDIWTVHFDHFLLRAFFFSSTRPP